MVNNTYCLGTDLSLEPHREQEILVFLVVEWKEDTVVSRHPDFEQANIKVVGEVAEGGDHMHVSVKNLSDHPVTIEEDALVVQLHPRDQRECLPSMPDEDGNMTTASHPNQVRMRAEADDTAGGTHGVDTPGSFLIWF